MCQRVLITDSSADGSQPFWLSSPHSWRSILEPIDEMTLVNSGPNKTKLLWLPPPWPVSSKFYLAYTSWKLDLHTSTPTPPIHPSASKNPRQFPPLATDPYDVHRLTVGLVCVVALYAGMRIIFGESVGYYFASQFGGAACAPSWQRVNTLEVYSIRCG